VLLASTLTVAFLMAGLAAWQQLRDTSDAATPKVLRSGLTLAALAIPVQIFVGDLHGLNTLEHQPQKIAAMEGIWKTERGAPLLLFAWPDAATQSNRYAIEVPKGASLILRHDPNAELKGIDAFPDAHPPVAPLFFAFRAMVGVGVLMLATSWTGWWLMRRRAWMPERAPRALLWVLTAMTFSGWIATVAGWYVTEIGRQPFVVFGLLRTAEVASQVPAPMIALTLTIYVTLYAGLIVAYVAVLRYLAEHPAQAEAEPPMHSAKAVAKAAQR
jgi:cytochrome d ubiquinol oxidase subunit I